MIELGVNIDHVATLRQARRTYEPDPVWARSRPISVAPMASPCICAKIVATSRTPMSGACVRLTQIKLNLEMAATDEMVGIACSLKPEMAMLVPEGRHEVTTEGGLDVLAQEAR
jgi:pyridoxine 5-phosphate synthase